ncbi:MAG: alkaline phosphatase family protein [Verrucomicrobiota bacterium]|nr:alkaline phosphatase family protein [Verrucomicrobiota bacterium]
MSEGRASKILLVGWDAAELSIIMPMIDAGEMPQLERLMNDGAIGSLNTIQPLFAPLLWTSVATGKLPQEHGVLASFEPDPSGRGVRPFASESRRTNALWNILRAENLRAHVIGWPATAPAEPSNGVIVSDIFNKASASADDWPLPRGAVSPEKLAEDFAELRLHPTEFSTEQLKEFVPGINTAIDDPLVWALAHHLAECSSTQFAATYALDNQPWDFAAVYFDALDPICRDFLQFAPPRLAHIAPAKSELFQNVVRETYRLYDQMLGKLLELAGNDATVIVCSASGYFTGEERPVLRDDEHGSGAITQRPRGFAIMRGPGIRRDEWFYGADILGVTPTIFTLLGLPIGADMRGRPWVQALENAPEKIDVIESWEARLPRKSAARPQIALLDDPARAAQEEIDYNLGVCLLMSNRASEAMPLLEQMVRAQPQRTSPVLNLISCHHALGHIAQARELLEARAQLPDAGMTPHEGKRSKFIPQWDLMRGLLDLAEGKFASALTHLEQAQAAQPQLPGMHLQLGRVYAGLRRRREAEHAFVRALEIDPDNADANFALSLLLYRRREFQRAAEYSMQAAGPVPDNARAHLVLGLSLAHLGNDESAVVALHHALQRDGTLVLAHRALAMIYRKSPMHAAIADLHRRTAQELKRRRAGK